MLIGNVPNLFVKYMVYFTLFQIIEANEHNVHKAMSKTELSKYFGVKKHDQVPEYDITHPSNVDQDGHLLSYHHSKVPHSHKRVHYNISAFGDHFNLHLEKNEKLFKHDLHIEVLGHKGKILKKEKVGNCFYHGYSKNHRNSKVALSNCEHLSGVINTVEHSYVIQPLPHRLRERFKRSESDNDIAHIIYRTTVISERQRRSLRSSQNTYCETKDDPLIRLGRSTDTEQPDSERHEDETDPEKYIETLLVVDDKMCAFHGEDAAKQFALAACNIASGLLKDDTIGANPINLIITKMQIHTVPQDGLLINNHAMNSLSSFGKWAERNTVPDDTDPQHYDYATLFTRYDICKDENQPCDTFGVSNVGGMCQFPHSVSICKDNGLMIGRTLAHETGHALGMNHDERPFCGDSKKMMSLHSEGSEAYEWSKCSRMFLRQFLDSRDSRCLDDRPMMKHVINLDMFNEPGLLYDADQQCSLAFGDGAKYCTKTADEICTKLWCSLSDDDHVKCRSLNQPMAEGTPCGKTEWCKRGKCVDKDSEGLGALDGSWSSWSVEYTPCTRSCSNGVQYRTRQCNNPLPSNGGKYCLGEHREYRLCNTQACQDNRNFRDIQCEEKNKEMFNDKFFKWEWRPSNLKNKCTLGCFIKDTSKGYAFGNVEDGTDCDEETNDKCVNGECVHVGCDGIIGSLAKPDRCGICDGDGTTCTIDNSTEQVKKEKLTKKYKEQGQTFKKTLSFLKTLGYDVPESYASADTDEVIAEYYWALVKTGCSTTCGQGTELSRSECRRSDDSSPVAQKYCDIKKKPRDKTTQCNRQQCKPEWRTDRWDDCSKSCNGGKRTRHVKCVQMIGDDIEFDVEEEMCDPNTKPATEENCNEQECAAEWVAQPFGKCSTTCGHGVQIRKVACQKVSKEGNTEDVELGRCAAFIRPTTRESCNVHNPCPGQGKCGGTYEGVKGYLTSPNYPESYPNDKECMHSIIVPQNKIIKLHFNSFDLDGNENKQLEGSCIGDFIRVKDSNCEKFDGAETLFCGDNRNTAPYLSTGNKICLKFYSDESSTNKGFNATYEAIDQPVRPKDICGSDITASVGLLTSPNYPEPYPDNEICNMTIKTPQAPIKLNFQYFDVGENGDCNEDFVVLHGGNSQAERICGNRLPKLYTVYDTTLQLSFISGQQNKKKKLGFVATYTSGKEDAILKSDNLSAAEKIQNKTKKQTITTRSKLQDLVDSLRDTIPHPESQKPKVQFFPISSNSFDSKEVSAQQVSGATPKVLFISDTKQQNKTDEAKKSETNITTVDNPVNTTTEVAENNTENGKTRQFIARPMQSVLEQQGALIIRGQCPHPQRLSCINLLYSYPCSGINDNSCSTRGMDCCPTSCSYGPNMCVPKVARECPLLTPYLGGNLDTCATNNDCHEHYICCVDMLGRKYCRKQREID